jgi:hypothetical protein
LKVLDSNPDTPEIEVKVGSDFLDRDCFVALNRVDNTGGIIELVVVLKGGQSIQDSAELAIIEFEGKLEGESLVKITDSKLIDSGVNYIQHTTLPAKIVVKEEKFGWVEGIVRLEGRDDFKDVLVTLNGKKDYTNSQGQFYFPQLLPGLYTLTASCPFYLRGKTPQGAVKVEQKKGTKVLVELPAGDVNGDDVINILDLIKIASTYGRQQDQIEEGDPDINQDGAINIIDLVLAARNFGKTSEDVIIEVHEPSYQITYAPKESRVLFLNPKTATIEKEIVDGEGVKVLVDSKVGVYAVHIEAEYDPKYQIDLSLGDIFEGKEVFIAKRKAKQGNILLVATLIGKASAKKKGCIFQVRSKGGEVLNLKLTKVCLFDDVGGKIRVLSSNKQDLKVKVPREDCLLPNFPNPFNPETWIPFKLSKGGEVSIRIYNLAGQLVRVLNMGYLPAGNYSSKDRSAYWDGKNTEGEEVSSGIYIYQLIVNGKVYTRKMVALK